MNRTTPTTSASRWCWMERALALLIVVGSLMGVAGLWMTRTPASSNTPAAIRPTVSTVFVRPESMRLSVRSQGTVQPWRVTHISAEVAGRVTEVSDKLRVGGFFEADDVMFRIDDQDYHAQVVQARAGLAEAQAALEQEEAHAAQARREWASLGEGEPGRLTLREPQIERARARLAAAEAALARAKRQLDRSVIRAPYAGFVQAMHIELGQYLTPGMPLLTFADAEAAKVRLPLREQELAYLDLPLAAHDALGALPSDRQPLVTLESTLGGEPCSWLGRLVHLEAAMDERSRMLYAVVRVEDPYARRDGNSATPSATPLMSGMFVEATIDGREFDQLVVLPASALRDGDSVFVVDAEGRLRRRQVELLRREAGRVIIRSGLKAGEQVAVASLTHRMEGLAVAPVAEPRMMVEPGLASGVQEVER